MIKAGFHSVYLEGAVIDTPENRELIGRYVFNLSVVGKARYSKAEYMAFSDAVHAWCVEQFGTNYGPNDQQRWYRDTRYREDLFVFKLEDDSFAFRMRWG